MPAEQTDGFADNWTYLRTELHWLDRLLMAAVAKQRKETKDIDRIAQSKADRATSHWWKGIITAEGNIAYDEYRQPTVVKPNYSNQIEARIQATHRRGILLALPALRERLGLSLFEKNLVLMSLAPEINRRYAQLYRYLCGEDSLSRTDLPTLDLALRLLCKNDQEWRSAREHLLNDSGLTRYKLLSLLPSTENTLLNSPLKLSTPLVNYLLSERPTAQALDELLRLSTPVAEMALRKVAPALKWLQQTKPEANWTDLLLPGSELEKLKRLTHRIHGYIKALELWDLAAAEITQPGLIALLAGASGTGKTFAAQVLATELQASLYQVDLAHLSSDDYPALFTEIRTTAPIVLLIQSAELWLKRSSQLSKSSLQQFWAERRQVPAITLFSVRQPAAVQVGWQRQFDQQIAFELPTVKQRIQLWQRAFPAQVPLDSAINWQKLATLPLSGGEIRLIAAAAIMGAASAETPIGLTQIRQALADRGKPVAIKPLPTGKKRTRKKSE
jgi:SpoVK/Ycf46/Vps4 family AAA+-type ATPase